MADAQLSTSITSISERASEVAVSASADELQKISRVAPSLEQSENAALEVAINTRAAAIAGTATAADLKKIGKAIGNMLEPQTTSVSGEFIGSQTNHSGKFFSTNGTARNWGGVTMGGLQQVQLSTIENDQTLVYNSVSGKFENSSRAFDIPQYSLTQNLPASANAGEVVFDVQSSQLKYWDGSEWKVAAVVAAAGAGGVSIVSVTVTEKFGETETNSMVSGNSESYAGLGNYDNIRFSPNGQNMIIGAGHYKTPGVGRGSTWIVDTSDLNNITHEQWRPQYIRNGNVDTDYAGMGKFVDITDTHVATYTERPQATQLLNETVFNAAVSNHANTPWPLGYLASGSVNWVNFNAQISIAPLSDLSSPFFLALTGNYVQTDYHGGVFGMSGNYVAVGTNATPYGPYNEGIEGAYAAGMWVYDITDSESTFTGNDFTASNTYLDTRNQNIIFPKYFIPRYSAGTLGDYDNRYVFVDVSGDYIIRGAGNANGGQGRVEIYKISQLQTIVSGNAQVAPHAVINGDGSNTPNHFGYKVSTDGNKIIVGGTGGSGNKVIVYDMNGTVLHTVNAADFISDQLTSLDISPYYIGFGAKNSNTGASSGGEYAILALDDPTSVLKTESGSSNNERMGDSFAFGHDTNVYAFTSMMPNETGRLSINEIIATTDSAGSGESSGESTPAITYKLVVGSEERNSSTGYAYVYDLDGTNEVLLGANDGGPNLKFGSSVAIGNDKIVVGSVKGKRPGSNDNTGAAYVYNVSDLSGGLTQLWSNQVKLNASDAGSNDEYGYSVAVGNNKIAVGARYSNVSGGSINGAVYVYDLDGSNEVKITASDLADYDLFGQSVAIGYGKIVVGAYGDDDSGSSSGSVYVYDLDGSNEVKITASDGAEGDNFGYRIAIGENKIVVSSHKSSNEAGAVYVYDLDGSNEVKITASDAANGDYFGGSVAIGESKIVVGAYQDDDNGKNSSGSVYVYDLDGTNEVKITSNSSEGHSNFGSTVAIANGKIFVGEDEGGSGGAGSVKVYDLDGTNEIEISPASGAGFSSGSKFGRAIAVPTVAGVTSSSSSSSSSSSTPVDWSPLTISTTVASSVYNLTDAAPINPNPNFDTDSDWYKDRENLGTSFWTISGGQATMPLTDSYRPLYQRNFGMQVGETYTATIVVSAVTGSMKWDLAGADGHSIYGDGLDANGAGYGRIIESPGTYSFTFTYTGTQRNGASVDGIGIARRLEASCTVDSMSVKLSSAGGGTTGESDLSVDMSETHTVVGIDKAYSGYGSIKLIDNATGVVQWSVDNPNPVTAGSFGRRNSVGTDGTHVVVGNRDQDEVYVYDISGTLLRTISGPDAGAQFGHSVKIDGDYIAVGGYNQDKAYICSTSTGAVLHTLTNPNVYGSTPDQFGQVVDISGNFMVVSTVEEDAADGSNSGVAYVYTVDAGSLLHTFVNPNAHGTSALDNFGIDCALDGNYLVVGAFGESDAAVGSGSGKAYFYNVATGTLLHTIDNPNPDSGTDVDYMGWSVAVDGQTALVSAWYETGTAGADAGKCYLYDIVSGNLLHTIEDPDLYSASGTDDRFGSEVAIAGNYFAVSAKGEDHSSQDNVGALYVFKGE